MQKFHQKFHAKFVNVDRIDKKFQWNRISYRAFATCSQFQTLKYFSVLKYKRRMVRYSYINAQVSDRSFSLVVANKKSSLSRFEFYANHWYNRVYSVCVTDHIGRTRNEIISSNLPRIESFTAIRAVNIEVRVSTLHTVRSTIEHNCGIGNKSYPSGRSELPRVICTNIQVNIKLFLLVHW